MRHSYLLFVIMIIGVTIACNAVAIAGMQKMWGHTYYQTDSEGIDIAWSVVTDQDDNVTIVGQTEEDPIALNNDVFVAQYDLSGQLQWTYIYNGPANHGDVGYQAVTANNGDIFIAGGQSNQNYDSDGLVIKLSKSGSLQWVSAYNGIDEENDTFYLIRHDGNGRVICGGYAERLLYGSNAFAAIYDETNGVLIDSVAVDGTENDHDYANDIAVDSNGAIYLSGSFVNTGSLIDIGVVKILPDGTRDWMETFNGTGNDIDWGGSIALDDSNNVYIAGTQFNSLGNYDPGLMYVDSQGPSIWNVQYPGESNLNETLPNIIYDSDGSLIPYFYIGNNNLKIGNSGNLFLVVMDGGLDINNDIALLKIAPNGNLIWRQKFDGPTSKYDECWDFVVDSQENVYIAGSVYRTAANPEPTIIQYDTDGNLIDTQYYVGSTGVSGSAHSITLDGDENPIIAGWVYNTTTETDAFVAKYCVGCLIDDACYPDGTVNPNNQDQICDVSLSQTAWSDNSGDDDDDDDTSDDDDDTSDDDDDDTSDEASAESETSAKSDDSGCCG